MAMNRMKIHQASVATRASELDIKEIFRGLA